MAVQRKYESVRRAWKLDENDSCKEHELQRGKRKKYRAWKKRVIHLTSVYMYLYIYASFTLQKFDNRALVVSQTELQRWKQLNINYMSDEYDDEDPQVAVLHQPVWRSKSRLYYSCVYTLSSV